jgi:hypothetical protein
MSRRPLGAVACKGAKVRDGFRIDGSQPEAATARGQIERTLVAAGILPAPGGVFEGHGLFGSHRRRRKSLRGILRYYYREAA